MMRVLNLEQIRANYLCNLQNQNPAARVHAGSDSRVCATAIAAVGEGQYQHQEWILRQIFAGTADSAYLEKHAVRYGAYRKTATFAGGKVRVRGAVGATVPVGQQINVGDKVYLTAESAVIDALGSAETAVIATVAGSAQNQTAESTATLQSVPAGIDSSAVLLMMVGSTDAENDESLLARYEERLRRPTAGNNQYGLHNWCLEVPGAADILVYSLRRGNGFVDAVILGENGIPSVEALTAVQVHVGAVQPITRKNGFLALTLNIRTMNVAVITILNSGTDTDTATAAIKSAVNAYFDALKPGDTLIKSQLETLIGEVCGVRSRALTTPVGNTKPQENAEDICWLCPGGINMEYTM